MKIHSRLIICLLGSLFLTACGWQLKGSSSLDQISSVHISARSSDNQFVRMLNREIESQNIVIADNATEAAYSIVILDNREKRRTVSVSNNGRAAEYLLTEEVDFLLLDQKGNQLGGKRTYSAERVYDHNESRAVGKSQEQNTLRQEMYRTLSQQILRTLARTPH